MTSSASNFGRDHGLIHEVIVTGRKAGWGASAWSTLAHDLDLMKQFREVVDGRASIVPHVINCDAWPFVPDGWTCKEHRKGGQFVWDASKVRLYLDYEGQQRSNEGRIKAHKLHKLLANLPTVNANVLDYLIDHSHLIPQEWKRQTVLFWGTIYMSEGLRYCVRSLFWDRGWQWGVASFNADLGRRHPAAVLAAQSDLVC